MSVVYKCLELPDQEFDSREEMFKALQENAENIIDLKKGKVIHSDSLKVAPVASKGLNLEAGFVYPVINTTLLMDSHNDVHANGIWKATVKQQQGKIFYVADHKLEVTSVIAFPQDVQMMVKTMTWQELGFDFAGNTEALIFKIAEDKIRLPQAQDIIKERISIENSVRMQYVKIDLAINSESPDFKREKAVWNKHFNKIANKERAEEKGFFWWVGEAKIFKEGSMVLMGSNEATPLLLPEASPEEKIDPLANNQKHPSQDSVNIKRRTQLL